MANQSVLLPTDKKSARKSFRRKARQLPGMTGVRLHSLHRSTCSPCGWARDTFTGHNREPKTQSSPPVRSGSHGFVERRLKTRRGQRAGLIRTASDDGTVGHGRFRLTARKVHVQRCPLLKKRQWLHTKKGRQRLNTKGRQRFKTKGRQRLNTKKTVEVELKTTAEVKSRGSTQNSSRG